ncbi:hypothetical protein H9Q71_000162 [Fusarium xylarioides]|nr:hypothetical protein H9Q71_000162 [Fusarium xylarioides]
MLPSLTTTTLNITVSYDNNPVLSHQGKGQQILDLNRIKHLLTFLQQYYTMPKKTPQQKESARKGFERREAKREQNRESGSGQGQRPGAGHGSMSRDKNQDLTIIGPSLASKHGIQKRSRITATTESCLNTRLVTPAAEAALSRAASAEAPAKEVQRLGEIIVGQAAEIQDLKKKCEELKRENEDLKRRLA